MRAQRPQLPYRRDIDGLRAIAVLSVVLYHFGLPLPGGFVGVDIFFVISGFLIGGILWREYDNTGRISVFAFYLRRFRRLAPASFAVFAACIVFGWLLLLPFDYREFAKTLISALIFLSNVYFYRKTGYFDSNAEEKPLLHTWSLAVEEQFYLVLPLTIVILARWKWGFWGSLWALWATSLSACILFTPTHQAATFFLFPFRAWELLSGVLLAIWAHNTKYSFSSTPYLSHAGIVLLAASIALIPAGEGFPGWYALAPVLGTVLLILNGRDDNPVNRILTTRIFVFFGLISYSLYLWHWPVFTFSIYLRETYTGAFETGLWIFISIVLGWLSWRFIETPFRKPGAVSDRAILLGTLAGTAGALSVGAYIYLEDGITNRFDKDARIQIAGTQDFLQDWSRCYVPTNAPFAGLDVCPIGPEGAPQVLIWGDSHVRAFKEGLEAAAHEADIPSLIVWRAGCAPLFGLQKTESAATAAQDSDCSRANQQIQTEINQLKTVERVLLVGRWAYYTSGTGFGLDAANRIDIKATKDGSEETPQPKTIQHAAEATVSELSDHGFALFVLRQPPEIPKYDSRLAAREAVHHATPFAVFKQTDPTAEFTALEQRAGDADRPWQRLRQSSAITWIDPWPQFCDANACHAVIDGVVQYFDNNHITNSASLRVRSIFAPLFEPRD